MENILNARNYTLIFSDPDIILCGSFRDRFIYSDEAEEFAKSFFSKDILSKEYIHEKELLKAKQWLVGILYHERGNSIPEVKDLTGYKSTSAIQNYAKKFGPLRSIREGVDRAFKKKYGKSQSAFMKDRWENMDDEERAEMGRAASEGLIKYWRESSLRQA